MRTFLFLLLLDPAATDNAGGGGAGDANAGKAGDDGSKAYDALLKKHENDHAAMARTLHGENAQLRSDLAATRSKLPADGSVVLSGDDAAHWSELAQLGKPGDLRAKLDAGATAAATVAKFERRDLIGSAASAAGFDAEVLATLAGDDLRIEVKDGTRNGKPARLAEVVTVAKDDKGAEVEKRTPLEKHAEANWAKFLPSLKGGKASPAAGSPPSAGGAPRPQVDPEKPRRSLFR